MNNNLIKPKRRYVNEPQNYVKPTDILHSQTDGIIRLSESELEDQVVKLFDTMLANFWKPKSTKLSPDLQKLSEIPTDLLDTIFKSLAQLTALDSFNTINPMDIDKYLKYPEFSLLLAYQAGQEAVHTTSYSYMFETFIVDKNERLRVYNLAISDPHIVKRNQFIIQFFDQMDYEIKHNQGQVTPETLGKAILAIYILEGIFFYNTFTFFHKIAHTFGYMNQVETIISEIKRDEVIHIAIFQLIINTIRSNNNGKFLIPDSEIEEIISQAIAIETDYSIHSYNNLIGMNETTISIYTKYLGNKLLRRIGLPDNKFHEYTKNPNKLFDDKFDQELNGVSPYGNIEADNNVFVKTSSDYIQIDKQSLFS